MFCFVIFLGAFLLFQVQPLIGKYILPWFGGGPGVWTTCLLFFQVMLFAGYAYAHWLSGWPLARQVKVHLVLLVLAFVALPITPADSWKPGPGEEPVGRILLLLIVSVGLPYLVLASTGPLAQAWFSRANPGRSPYRLYALSNVGSLLALVTFPFLVEPNTPRTWQVNGWSLAAVLYLGLFAWVAWRMRGCPEAAEQEETEEATEPPRWLVPLWLLLPACGTVLLMSTTNLICQEIAVIPFLWVAPLALYLLTFIIAFDSPRWYLRPLFVGGFFVSAGASCWALRQGVKLEIQWQLAVYMATLFFGCMVCHGELYRLRPPSGRLTAYYLCLAGGGALGGLFVSLGAPALFKGFFWEFHFGLMLCGTIGAGLWLAAVWKQSMRRNLTLPVLLGLLIALGWGLIRHADGVSVGKLHTSRNFYGLIKVTEWSSRYEGGEGNYTTQRLLVHGRITHGGQYADPRFAQRPISYFGPDSGIGLAMTHVRNGQPKRVGVLGLGVGAVAAYANPGDVYRFYEINPAVTDTAENIFTYLKGARDRNATVDVVLGDGRLMLEAEPGPMRFDLLSMDAFSSDSVPVHLLTNEAFEIYEKHLAPGGVIVINITNRYLDLEPVVRQTARHRGLHLRVIHYSPGKKFPWLSATSYVLLSRTGTMFKKPALRRAALAHHDTFADQLERWLKEARPMTSTIKKMKVGQVLDQLIKDTPGQSPSQLQLMEHARELARIQYVDDTYFGDFTVADLLARRRQSIEVPLWTDDYSSLFRILK